MGRLLVAFDGSEPSRRALHHAIKRAKLSGDEIVLLTVIPSSVAKSSLSGMMPVGIELPPPLSRTFAQNALLRLEETVKESAQSGVKMHSEVREGEAGRVIVTAASELAVDEVIIGHKSYEGEDTKLGPIAERLVRLLPATVTVVR